ncbi:MAG: hypothetical protein Q7R52_03015 [archaeon]|nr:hypothetical protein [archaeon]
MVKRKNKKVIKEKESLKVEDKKLNGVKVDNFNTLLSKAAQNCKRENNINVSELKSALSDVDWNLFKDELTQLDGIKSDNFKETKETLKNIDKTTTAKVINTGRNDR